VNLSARQFTQRDLVGHVGRTLAAHPVAPGSLVLEITESVLIDKADAAASMLERLAGLGVELHLDDFGTGYASLGYLQRFPVAVVKIDRSFVQGMEHEGEKARFIAAIVALTSRLGLRVVAEGVDSPAQLRLLRELGCDYAQGFLVSEPVSPREAERLLAEDPRW
jgi:EAL domain-containing protein (putative c-di-GMP-specific phosphodiesterase class I)